MQPASLSPQSDKPKRRWKRSLITGLIGALIGLGFFYGKHEYRRRTLIDSVPDIGFPFSDELVAGIEIEEKNNAYRFYRQAVEVFQEEPEDFSQIGYRSSFEFRDDLEKVAFEGWGHATRGVRIQLEKNRKALELWLKGTRISDARYIDPRQMNMLTILPVDDQLRKLSLFALAEASRLSYLGRHDESFQYVLGGLRCGLHAGRYGCMMSRIVGRSIFSRSAGGLLLWATHEDVTSEQLQAASSEVSELFGQRPPIQQTILAEYYSLQNTRELIYEGREERFREANAGWRDQIAWYFLGEPEISRKLTDHVFGYLVQSYPLEVEEWYVNGNGRFEAESIAQLPNGEKTFQIDRSMMLVKQTVFLDKFFPPLEQLRGYLAYEVLNFRMMELALALQIYARDHPSFPETLEQLVPRYLEQIPIDPFHPDTESLRGDRRERGFRVYSVGADGQDDGGSEELMPEEDLPLDIVQIIKWPSDPATNPLVAPRIILE